MSKEMKCTQSEILQNPQQQKKKNYFSKQKSNAQSIPISLCEKEELVSRVQWKKGNI